MIQVTITGEPGCGKTTVARLVAKGLPATYYSTGSIQREIAQSRGLTTLELNRLSETDKSVDDQIDSRTKALASSRESIVVDSRLAWRFLPRSIKVFLVCPPTVAASRVFAQGRQGEEYASRDQAIEALLSRYESEKTRFAKYYGASLATLRNFDLVIDTSIRSPEDISRAICGAAINRRNDQQAAPHLLISPESLLPTQDIREVSQAQLGSLRTRIGDADILNSNIDPVQVCRVGSSWGIVDGHKRVALALNFGNAFISAALSGQDDEVLWSGVTARSLFEDSTTWSRIYDWEAAFGFKFLNYPSFLPKPQRAEQ